MKRITTKKNQQKIEFSPEELAFIADNWQMADRAFLAAFEERFGPGLCYGYWRDYKFKHRLIKQKQVSWTPEQVQFLLDNYQTMGNVDIAAALGWHNLRKKGEKRIWKKMLYMGLKRTWEQELIIRRRNGGRGLQAYRSNRVAKGLLAHHKERHDGEQWQSKDGHWLIKHDGQVKFLARHIWEQRFGSIPEGWMVCHYNGDKSDNRWQNLCLRNNETHGKNMIRKAVQGLSDNYVAGMLAQKDHELRAAIKQQPILLELKRQQLINQRKIKSIQNG